MSPTPKPGILEISPYVGGRASVPGVAKVFKLSSNESPLGPSPKALAALEESKGSLSLYPEGSGRVLREAIAEVHGLDPAVSSPRATVPTPCSPCWLMPICGRATRCRAARFLLTTRSPPWQRLKS